MIPTAFKPQNFYDSSLCEAIDRLCRASGIVGVNWNFETREWSDEARPWSFIDSRNIRREPRDGTDSLTEFLNERKTKEEIAAATVLSEQKQALNDALRPLFFALEEGVIVANGFIKAGKRQAVQMTACDAARWAGNWTITRRADTAEVSFFIDIEIEDAAAALAAVRLGAPPQVQAAARPPNRREAADEIYDDTEQLDEIRRLLENGEARSVNAAINTILRNPAKQPKGASDNAIAERLRSKFKRHFEIIKTKGKPVRVIPRHPDDTRTG